jgi:hypothetical protein
LLPSFDGKIHAATPHVNKNPYHVCARSQNSTGMTLEHRYDFDYEDGAC